MIITHYKNGSVKIHIEDSDLYDVTGDNGVDWGLTRGEVEKLRGELK